MHTLTPMPSCISFQSLSPTSPNTTSTLSLESVYSKWHISKKGPSPPPRHSLLSCLTANGFILVQTQCCKIMIVVAIPCLGDDIFQPSFLSPTSLSLLFFFRERFSLNGQEATFQFTALPQSPACWSYGHMLFYKVCFGGLHFVSQSKGAGFHPCTALSPSPS